MLGFAAPVFVRFQTRDKGVADLRECFIIPNVLLGLLQAKEFSQTLLFQGQQLSLRGLCLSPQFLCPDVQDSFPVDETVHLAAAVRAQGILQ